MADQAMVQLSLFQTTEQAFERKGALNQSNRMLELLTTLNKRMDEDAGHR